MRDADSMSMSRCCATCRHWARDPVRSIPAHQLPYVKEDPARYHHCLQDSKGMEEIDLTISTADGVCDGWEAANG